MKYRETRHTPEQIIDKLQRVKRMVAEGGSVESACQALRIGLSTLYRWRKRYGEMTWQQARQLYEYEIENRRRDAIRTAQEMLRVSQRLACWAVRQPRSTQRYGQNGDDDREKELVARIRALAKEHPRYGYRRIGNLLNAEGWHADGTHASGRFVRNRLPSQYPPADSACLLGSCGPAAFYNSAGDDRMRVMWS